MKFKNKSDNSLKYIIIFSWFVISAYAATPFNRREGSSKVNSRGSQPNFRNGLQASRTNFAQNSNNNLPFQPIPNRRTQIANSNLPFQPTPNKRTPVPSQYGQISYDRRGSSDTRLRSSTQNQARADNIIHNTHPTSSTSIKNKSRSTPSFSRNQNDLSLNSRPDNRPSSQLKYDTSGTKKGKNSRAYPGNERNNTHIKRESTPTISGSPNERRNSPSRSKNSTVTASGHHIGSNQQNSTKHYPQLSKSMKQSNSTNLNNATFVAPYKRNSSTLKSSPKFSLSAKGEVIPVVLKQSNLNAFNKTKSNTTAFSHNVGRNTSTVNNATAFLQSERVNYVMPIVQNRSKVNSTDFSHKIARNMSVTNNATKFSQSGKSNFVPVILKQPLLNATNRSNHTEIQAPVKPNNQNPSENSFFAKIAKALPFLKSSHNSSSVKGFNPSSTDKKSSTILKNIIKALKKSNSDEYKIDYGTPMKSKGSELKLLGGKLTNSITGYFMAILVLSLANRW